MRLFLCPFYEFLRNRLKTAHDILQCWQQRIADTDPDAFHVFEFGPVGPKLRFLAKLKNGVGTRWMALTADWGPGKERLLVEIGSASIEEPAGRVCDVIFPIVGKDKLAAIVKESQAKGALDRRIYKVMRSSWANHYRRMLPNLLSVLEFPFEQHGVASGACGARLDSKEDGWRLLVRADAGRSYR